MGAHLVDYIVPWWTFILPLSLSVYIHIPETSFRQEFLLILTKGAFWRTSATLNFWGNFIGTFEKASAEMNLHRHFCIWSAWSFLTIPTWSYLAQKLLAQCWRTDESKGTPTPPFFLHSLVQVCLWFGVIGLIWPLSRNWGVWSLAQGFSLAIVDIVDCWDAGTCSLGWASVCYTRCWRTVVVLDLD